MTDSGKKDLDAALGSVSESRRQFLRKVVVTAAFTAPVVASFAVDGMMVSSAFGGIIPPNSSNVS